MQKYTKNTGEGQNIPKCRCSEFPICKRYLLPYVPFVGQGFLWYRKCFVFENQLNTDSDTKVKHFENFYSLFQSVPVTIKILI